jgi:membrane protein DedA with SNARE-associated domain
MATAATAPIGFFVYFLIFILMFVEGGDATLLTTGFLIKLGYLNPFLTIPVVLCGAILRDIILYKIGEKYGEKFILKYGKFLLINQETFRKIEKRLKKTRGKTIFFSKFIYGLNHIAIFAVGAIKIDFRRFLKIDILTILIWEAILLGLGYFLGHSFHVIRHYIKDVGIFLVIILIVFFLSEALIRQSIKLNGNNK